MCEDVFQFNTEYSLQLIGSAMGTLQTPTYAVLYFGIRELKLRNKYTQYNSLNKCYIDDVFRAWITQEDRTEDLKL